MQDGIKYTIKSLVKLWLGVLWQNTSYKLRSENLKEKAKIQKCKFRSTSYEFKSASSNSWVTSLNSLVGSSNLRVRSSNPRVTSSNLRVASSNPRVQELFNQWKFSSFPKILKLKCFGNLWGKSYFQFLVIISCFTFPLLHRYGFSKKQRE